MAVREDREHPQAIRRFYQLVWPHRAAALRVAGLLCGGDSAEAEDLAQDTMLKAFRAIGTLREGTDAKAWLLAILRHARIDRLRAARKNAGDVSLAALKVEPGQIDADATRPPEWGRPEEVLEAFSDRQIIAALRELPEEIRWTLLLIDVEGLDYQDAAGVLGVPVGTIRSRGHRGRAMLRQALLPLARDRRIVRD